MQTFVNLKGDRREIWEKYDFDRKLNCVILSRCYGAAIVAGHPEDELLKLSIAVIQLCCESLTVHFLRLLEAWCHLSFLFSLPLHLSMYLTLSQLFSFYVSFKCRDLTSSYLFSFYVSFKCRDLCYPDVRHESNASGTIMSIKSRIIHLCVDSVEQLLAVRILLIFDFRYWYF